MAPVRKRTALRARASRANDPRGKYAPPPPPPSAHNTAAPADLLPDANESPADTHTGPAAGKRSAETAFGFDSNEGFKVSKKDKRTIRHNQLLAKVQDADARVGKKKLKRRRPGKKLATNLDSLADALPEMEDEAGEGEDDWEGISEDENDDGMAGVEGFRKVKRRRRTPGGTDAANRMKMTSLRHRPGAMKRKHRMEQGEMERFGRNLAQMVGSGQANVSEGKSSAAKSRQGDGSQTMGGEDASAGAASQSDRWAALRRFIGGTLEQNQAFAGNK
ncbi:hypothetical protein KC354_g4315 [Hortaea werneckii]|nr:hypothetical protein KC354_g4315 [Hortaea werneckii]